MSLLKDKIVLITGASSGIGRACAKEFAAQGARLLLVSRQKNQLDLLAKELQEEYGSLVLTYGLDVRDKNAVLTYIKDLPKEWRKIDILINNAGLALGLEKLQDGSIEDWETMIDTNIKGLLYLTRQVIPLMIDYQLKGQIINVGSLAGIAAYPYGAVYCATKAAVKIISDGLRMDVVDLPIRVTNIQPGMVETNFSITRFHGDKQKARNFYQGIIPLSEFDVAQAILWSANRPEHVQICEITLTPTQQATGGVVHRKA